MKNISQKQLEKRISKVLKEWAENWFGESYEDLDIQDLKVMLLKELEE